MKSFYENMKDATAISQFFENFKSIRNLAGTALAEDAQRKLPDFFKEFSAIHQQIFNEKKRHTPDYNLFHILRIRHFETITHTPFLVNLLNPEASHAQGDLFIKSFLERIVGFDSPTQYRLIEIRENKVTPYGNIDIFLRFEWNNVPYALVLENKVYAADQADQLKRYFDYCKIFCGFPESRIKILYLTLYGAKPGNNSIKNEDFDELTDKSVLKLAGYKSDIVSWLSDCCLSIPQKGKLYFSIEQYIQTIKSL